MLAQQTRVQGAVRLQAIIGIDGSVEELEVISGQPVFIQSALDAVRKWRYAPTSLNGQPVEVDTTIDVIFSPEENRSPSVSSTATALVFADFPAPAGNGPEGLSLVLWV